MREEARSLLSDPDQLFFVRNRALEEKAQMTKALWSDLELKMKEKTETE